jgi:hypothetical protein
MEFWENIPTWLGGASAAALLTIVVYIFYRIIVALVALIKDVLGEREKISSEQRRFYETNVIPNFTTLTENLKTALAQQREIFDGKLEAVEREHKLERENWAEQVRQLTAQVDELTRQIAAVKQSKDDEIVALKLQLAEKQIALDTANARLAAMDAAQRMSEGEADGKVAADGKGADKEKR